MSDFTEAMLIASLLTIALLWVMFLSPMAKKRQERVSKENKNHARWFAEHTKDWNDSHRVLRISRNERALHIYYHGGGGGNKVLSPKGARFALIENDILSATIGAY